MPRQAREKSPTGYYHIMMRGIDRDFIYQSSKDKTYFVDLLKEAEQLDIVAYCLMDNHVHLVVQGDIVALSLALRKLNIKYAMHYNFVNKRVGHVFQNRYRSEIVEDDKYLAHLIRYVHNNPVKAGLVAEARQYRWSSYGEYLGNLNIVSPIQKRVVLGLFPKGTESFKIFHLEPDENEYLDTAEDIERDRLKRAQTIVAAFCSTREIKDHSFLKSNPKQTEELVAELLRHTKLSHRKIASLLDINAYYVHQVSRGGSS
ncbi:MAG: transposase [Firmicutes bacterium]|nr:transposase [Dethiobacter sp.]MBS3887852.1 transposase [Bacillota bacterium]